MQNKIFIERLDVFQGCFTSRISWDDTQRSKEAYFIFHGFPANRGFRNQDIAEEICWRTRGDVYLLHYTGLGKSSGKFSFPGSVAESVAFAEEITQRFNYERVHIVGHSWGGLVSMNVAKAVFQKLGKIVLLAPFNFIAQDERAKKAVAYLMKETPIDYAAGTLDGVLVEMEKVLKDFNPREIAKIQIWRPNQVTIFQSLNDADVPEFTTREYVQLFSPPPKYVEMVADHSFLDNREKIVDLVCQELQAF